MCLFLIHNHSLSPSFNEFMKGLRFFSNKTAVSVWFLLRARHVISSRIICTWENAQIHKGVGPLQSASTLHKFASISLIINAAPEASPEPSSQPRRSTGHGHVLSEPGPIGSIYVKQLPSGSQCPCSPGCPPQLPVLLDDAFKI